MQKTFRDLLPEHDMHAYRFVYRLLFTNESY